MNGQFDAPAGIVGTIEMHPVDPAKPDSTPYVIVRTDPWELPLHWELAGEAAELIGGGDFVVSLYFNRVDEAVKGKLDQKSIAVDSAPRIAPRKYDLPFAFSGGILAAGLYQFTAVVNCVLDGRYLPLHGFAETMTVDFVEP